MLRRSARPRRTDDGDDDAEDDDGTTIVCEGVCVYFYADVSRANTLALVKCLREATVASLQHAPPAPLGTPCVYLYIHSNGGDAYAGLSAYDHIRHNPVPVVTIADGAVASAASFLLLAAERRLCLAHAFVRIHQLSISGLDCKYADMVDEMQNSHCMMEKIETLYVTRTGMDVEHCRMLLRQEIDMDAERCVREGLVHEILVAPSSCAPVPSSCEPRASSASSSAPEPSLEASETRGAAAATRAEKQGKKRSAR